MVDPSCYQVKKGEGKENAERHNYIVGVKMSVSSVNDIKDQDYHGSKDASE